MTGPIEAAHGLAERDPTDPVRMRRALRHFVDIRLSAGPSDRAREAESLVDFATKLESERAAALSALRSLGLAAVMAGIVAPLGAVAALLTMRPTLALPLAIVIGAAGLAPVAARARVLRLVDRQAALAAEIRRAAGALSTGAAT